MMKWHTKGVNDMKKITNLLLVLMLMTSIVSLAFADEASDHTQGNFENENETHNQFNESGSDQNVSSENETEHDGSFNDGSFDSETEHEIEIMNNSLGAQVRLLQLEKALITNILKGAMVVQVLKGLDVNTTTLEAILTNLSGVLDEVRVADPAANNTVQIFVLLKNETINLTKQFRDTIRALLDDQTIKMIQQRLRNITSDELQNCSLRLQHWIRQFNRNQFYRLYGIIGETNTTLLNEYINGNITINQAKLQLHKLVNQMTKEKRQMIFSEVKEENIKRKIQAHVSMEDIKHHGLGNGHGRRP
jgi:hypothetical protein